MQGLDAAGKTTVLYKLTGDNVTTTIPTIGFNVETTSFRGQLLTVWDVGGRSNMRPLWRHYYPNTQGYVFVVDSNDRERMQDAQEHLHREMREPLLAGVKVLVLANKQDVPGALRPEEVAAALRLRDLAQPWHVQATVATRNEGLTAGFAWLAESMRSPSDPAAARPSCGTTHDEASQGDVALDYDPAASPVLAAFAPIQRGTQCPFARTARLWGGAGAPDATASALAEFVRRSEAGEALDGFVIDVGSGADLEACSRGVRRALAALSAADPARDHVMQRPKGVPQRGWHFRFAGASFFVTSFAPCYPPTSPRFAFGAAGAFLLLQPEMSFLRHNLPHDDGGRGVRTAIRALFANAGRGYAVPPTPRYAVAPFVVRPLDEAGPGVEWWEDASTRAGSDTTSDAEVEHAEVA